MGEAADTHHPDHARGPFHRVGLTKDLVDRRVVVRVGLEGDQPVGDPRELALGVLDEQRTELVL